MIRWGIRKDQKQTRQAQAEHQADELKRELQKRREALLKAVLEITRKKGVQDG